MENKPVYINYQDIALSTIKLLDEGKKPRLLLHVCCAPCAGYPLTFLFEHFDVTIFYNNSNIFPKEEFKKRLDNLYLLLNGLKKDYGYEAKVLVPPYDYDSYVEDLKPYAEQSEGHERCWICYRKRMEEAYRYAEIMGFDYFTTVMTVSREKNSQIINQIGKELEETHDHTKYFYSDFKKQDGFNKTVAIRKKYDLYYQNYCGCEYSLEATKRWLAAKAEKEAKNQ